MKFLKYIILTVSLACSSFFASSQSVGHMTDFHLSTQRIDMKKTSFRNMVNHSSENLQWESAYLSKTCTVLKKADGTQFYAGEVGERTFVEGEKGNETIVATPIKSGTGVLKTIYPQNTEYISGTWKKDLLSGDALIRDTSGMVFFCSWKRGKIVKGSKREATEDEKKKLQKDIKSFEAKIIISGI